MTEKPHDLSVLSEWTMALTRTLTQSAFYAPSHHQSRTNIEAIVSSLGRAINAYPQAARILMITADSEDADDALIAGIHHRPIPLSSVLKTTMGEHLRTEFMQFLNENKIAAISIHRDAIHRDFEAFIDLAAERIMATKDGKSDENGEYGEEAEPNPEVISMGAALRSRDVVAVQLVHVADVLAPMPCLSNWLPRVLLTELHAIIREIFIATGNDESIAGDMINELVRTHVLHTGGNQIIRSILLGAVTIPSPADDRTLANILAAGLPLDEASKLASELASVIQSRDDHTHPDNSESTLERELLRALMPTLQKDTDPQTKELLKLLQREGILSFQQLPEPVRDKVRIGGWTDQYIRNPSDSLRRISNIDDPAAFQDLLRALLFIFVELLKRENFDLADELLAHLIDCEQQDDPPFESRDQLMGVSIARMREVPRAPMIQTLGQEETRDGRIPILGLLSRMGADSFHPLVNHLHNVTDDEQRQEILDALRAIGPEIIPFVGSELNHLDHPWYFHRDIVEILGDIGDPRAEDAVRKALQHPHVRVRQMAIDTLNRLLGEEVWTELLGLLSDADVDVQNRIVRVLAHHGCRYADYLSYLKERLEHWAEDKSPDERELHACFSALNELAPMREGEPDFLESVQSFLDPAKGLSSLRRKKPALSESVRELAQETLERLHPPLGNSDSETTEE